MTRAVRSRLALLALVAVACNNTPPDRREWRPSDHDHTDNPGADQVVGGPDAGTDPELAQHGLNEVTIVAWSQNCVRCHGRLGRGDGPQGPMVHATDLSNPEWQKSVTDDDILKTLRQGRGLMPAFPLPEPTLEALVHLVRLIGQATAEDHAAPDGSAAAAPSGSAPRVASPHGSATARLPATAASENSQAGGAGTAASAPASSAHPIAPSPTTP